MSASASHTGRPRPGTSGGSAARPLARVFLRTSGLTALLSWAVLLVWASFGTGASTGSSGVYMIIGTVASVLGVAIVFATAATHSGLRTIAVALLAAVFASGAGWAVYSAMPEAGPDEFITHRAGVAALAYGFGVVGGGLLALSEFVVEGYAGGRVAVSRAMRRKIGVLAAVIVLLAAAALAPAMQRWAELANQDVRVGDAATASVQSSPDHITELSGVQRFVESPYGLLRVDHPDRPSPQAVTLLDPATGEAVWYHRRWNWRNAQAPVLSHGSELVGLSGPRADNPDDYQTRVLRAQTGEEVATAGFDGPPGRLLALADDRLLYTGERSSSFAAYDFSGHLLWQTRMPPGCEGAVAQISGSRVLVLADCVPAPDRPIARDYVLAFDVDTGKRAWEQIVDSSAEVVPESFLVTEGAVVFDSRIERRVTDGPFSARRFVHKLLAFDIEDGSLLWRARDQQFGSTNSSACGGTLHLSRPTEAAADAGEAAAGGDARATVDESGRRTVQLVECYSTSSGEGARLGVMVYDLGSGERLYRRSVGLGFTPLDPEVARGWSTVLPDNRALVAADRSLDPTDPECRLWEFEDGRAHRVEVDDEQLPEDWCREAQLTTVAGGAAVSFVGEDGTRGTFMVS